jgi:hypothetical protein
MSKYLDTSQTGDLPPTPDLPTRIRTSPRVKAILWSASTGMVLLVLIALFASHVL